MNNSRRLGMPLLVMVVLSILFYIINHYFPQSLTTFFSTLICDSSLFIFGMSLNVMKKSRGVYRKVFALVCAILLMFIQLGILQVSWLAFLHIFLFANPYVLSMLFIYFGFMFAD